HAARVQALSRQDNCLKDIGCRYDQKGNRFAFFFGNRHYAAEQFLLVMIENLIGLVYRPRAEGVLTMVETSGHDDHVLLGRIRVFQYFSQIIQVAWISDRHQNVACSHAESAAPQFLVAVHPKLLQALRLSLSLLGNSPLRYCKNQEKQCAEADPGDGRFRFREQVYKRGNEEDSTDDEQAQRDLSTANFEVAWDAPLPVHRILVSQHNYCQR